MRRPVTGWSIPSKNRAERQERFLLRFFVNTTQEVIMSIRKIAIAAAFASAVACGGVARAQDAMSHNAMAPSPMVHDSTSKDSMAHDTTAPNAMSHDGMSHGGMKKHDGMAHHGMKKDAMSHDSMSHDNAIAAPQDSMAKPN